MHPSVTNTRVLFAVGVMITLASCSGCFPFPKPEETSHRNYTPLAPLRMGSDVVALQIAVVRLDGAPLREFDGVWSKADLHSLSIDVRKRLDQNGFRTALFGSQLPAELTSALNWTQPLMTAEGDILFNSQAPLPPNHTQGPYLFRQIEQLNIGDQHWIPCTDVLPQLNWELDDRRSRRSGICVQAQCGWNISQIPLGDGSIKLWIRPVVRHGESKLRYGIDQETLLVQEQQERLLLEELDFSQRLRLGQTFILSCHESPIGLGKSYFAPNGYSTSRQALLIRLVRTGHDDLFAPEQTSRPLSTSLN